MELSNPNLTLQNDCNWTSDICPHHVYNFTNITEKAKMEGRQSRFLNLILGMDPLFMLRTSGQAAKPFYNGPDYDRIQYWGGTREVNRYRAVVNVKEVVEMFSFLYVLKIICEEGDTPRLHRGQPVHEDTFQKFAEKIEKRHAEKMENMRNASGLVTVIPEDEELEEEENNDAGFAGSAQAYIPPNKPNLKRYLIVSWYEFRKIGRLIMKNEWYIPHVWKAYTEYNKQSEFSDRILLIVKLTHLKP